MNKFDYGNYNSETEIVFDASKGFNEPNNETEVRNNLVLR